MSVRTSRRRMPLPAAEAGEGDCMGSLSPALTGLKPDTDYWFKVWSYVQLPDITRYYGQQREAVHTKPLK